MKKLYKHLLGWGLALLLVMSLSPANAPAVYAAPTPGLSAELTPQYGPNGKFLAAIGAVADGSIPIANRADLEKIGADASYPHNGSYHLTADIDLAGEDWTPITSFAGTFDGQGHVISNLTISEDTTLDTLYNLYLGLFGSIYGATVKNVGLEGTAIEVAENSPDIEIYAGGICGHAYNATISNCYNTGQVSVSST